MTAPSAFSYVGQAQEKATVMRTERRYGPTGTPYAWLVKASALVNHFYFYCFDDDFGPYAEHPTMPRVGWCGAA